MEQIAILELLRRHVAMIVAVCIVATVAGYAFSFLLPNRYTAAALVLVRPQQPIKMGPGKDSKEFLDFPMGNSASVETASKTYIEMIKSPALISEVVRQLGLDKEKDVGSGRISRFLPDFLKRPAIDLKEFLKNIISILKYGEIIEDDPFTKAIKDVSSGLLLEAQTDTYLFSLKYISDYPEKSADVANTTAKTLIKFVNELRLSESRDQLDYLKTALQQSRQQVISARERLEGYKKAHSVFLYEKEYDSKLKVIAELEVEHAKAEAALVGNQNTLSTMSLAARRARLIRSSDERKAELAPLPEMERELKQLDQDVKDALTAYEIVDKVFKEADIKHSYTTPEVRLVSEAVAPHLPSSTQRGIIALASLLSGLVAAIGLAILLEYLNRRVRGIRDVEDFVGIKVLATIPRISERRWSHAGL